MKLGAIAIVLLAGCSSSTMPGGDGFVGGGRDGFVAFDFAGGGGDGGSSGGAIYCGSSDSSECACGNDPAQGYTLGAHCASAMFGGSSLCCATAEWPGPTAGNVLDVGCVCSQIFCEVDAEGDVCQCGFAAPSQGDTPIGGCTGYVSCCRSRSTVAPTCACYTSNVPCSDGDEAVPSCAPSDVRCDQQTVSSCN